MTNLSRIECPAIEWGAATNRWIPSKNNKVFKCPVKMVKMDWYCLDQMKKLNFTVINLHLIPLDINDLHSRWWFGSGGGHLRTTTLSSRWWNSSDKWVPDTTNNTGHEETICIDHQNLDINNSTLRHDLVNPRSRSPICSLYPLVAPWLHSHILDCLWALIQCSKAL